MSKHVEELRAKYIANPPEGMTAGMIKRMRDNDLLDMDYFLHEDVFNEDVEDGFLSSNTSLYFICP